jgi:hypothetical protein
MFLSDWYYKRVGLDCNIKTYPPSPFGEKQIVISYLPAPRKAAGKQDT